MPIGPETYLQPALQPVFDKLFSMAGHLISKLIDVELKGTLKQWQKKIRMIKAVLDDAEQKQFHNNVIKAWLDDLQDLAFDMEDVLEHFAIQVHETELTKMDQQNVDRLSSAFEFLGSVNNMVTGISESLSTLFNPIINPEIQSQIAEITERLQDVESQIQYLGLSSVHGQQQTINTEALRGQRESASLACEPKIYGRDEKKQEIIAQLLKDDQSNEKNYVVIAIVGKGGLGKTTLAQYVYNDEQQLKGRFDIKAWVCVSDVFDVKRITTTIINAATDRAVVDFSNLNEAQERLKQELTSRKFLIVLDDIWSEKYADWNQLQIPFRHAAKGSRVIMTTRNEKIARMMIDESMNSNIFSLEGLSYDDTWSLFQQHINVDSDLAEMRDDIIEKCKGLPLAAKALGGLLKATPKTLHRTILQSKTWHEESDVLPVLSLSYNHLPPRLRRMFAYCSIFPKDYTFQEMEVVLLWMAQGFLPDDRPEDEGCLCFSELVSRSLFEVSQSSEEGFIIHDLIHDLAASAAHGLCYAIDTIDIPRDLKRTRHVSLTSNAVMLRNQLPLTSKLRTFYSTAATFQIFSLPLTNLDFIQKFRYIRTLCLYLLYMQVLPEYVGNLKHLRFLSLRYGKMKQLPKSMSYLWNLETLWLEYCGQLQKLPSIRYLGKLRHLIVGENSNLKEMPMGIGELTNLQSLNQFVLGDGRGERIRDLKNLNHLQGKLTISGLEHVLQVEDAKEAQLDKKVGLNELCLMWRCLRMEETDDISKEDVLEQLKPHNLIKQLELDEYMDLRFPTWLGNPCFSKMVSIRLVNCKKCEDLPPLGQLPSLKNIFIFGMGGIKEVGAEFYGDLRCQNPSFPVLESLKFKNVESWEKWVHSPSPPYKRAFLRLKELSIKDCPSLEGELPPHLPSLTKLIIKDCPSLEGELPPHLPSLTKLKIKNCKELSFSLQSVPLLEVLESERCNVIFNDGGGWCSDEGAEFVNIPCELAHLTRLEIIECRSPISLPEGLLLPALQYLEFRDCKNMESLPSQLHKYTSLKTLTIFKCPKIEEIPEGGLPINLEEVRIEDVNIKQRVQELAVYHLHSLRSLYLKNVGMTPEDLSLPSSLSQLTISGSQNLKTISSCITLPNLTTFQVSDCPVFKSLIGMFTSLSDLTIRNCPMFESLVANLGSLSFLIINDCPMFKSLIGMFNSLSILQIRNCPNFEFSAEGGLPRNLTHLALWGRMNRDKPIREWGLHLLSSLKILTIGELERSTTEAVECIPSPNLLLPSSSLSELVINGFQDLKSIDSSFPNLIRLRIKNCPKFESFGDHGLPPKLQHINSLSCLTIEDCPMFESLVANLGSLSDLQIRNCPNFEFSAEGGLPRNLTRLTLWGRMNRDKPIREWGLHLLSSLKFLELGELGRSTTEAEECIPSPNLLRPSSSLSYLTINGFQDLKSIDCSSFPNLITLWISNCPKFESFGDHGLPPKLQRMDIKECESLKPLLKIDPDGPIHMEECKYSLL